MAVLSTVNLCHRTRCLHKNYWYIMFKLLFIARILLYELIVCGAVVEAKIHGRYTKSLTDYLLSIPHKLTAKGEFSSFHLPHFHDHEVERNYKDRKKRSMDDLELVHYGVTIGNQQYHLELWPNRNFIHPNMVVEKRDPTISVKDRYVRTLRGKKLCHYTGRIRGIKDSKAAISTCDGLAGYILVGKQKYFIEPVENHTPNAHGHHLHVVHKRATEDNEATCGVKDSWEDAIKRRIREELLEGNDVFKTKRDNGNMDKFLEVAIICDKHFLTFHRGRDVELYVMTIMNMVADFYHDASIGHQMDVVVVRIIYLEKQEEEIDLEISRDAPKTLRSFCDWAIRLNTPTESPNHFDMALLLTRYDLCADAEVDCGLTGLAYVGGACSKDEHCGINEDNGLGLSVIVAHEMGHLMGAEHDEEESPSASQDNDGSNFVMSPFVNAYTIRWSTCSRSMITALVDSNLADCLYDQPDTSLYPYADNLPGIVYDSDEQCRFEIPASVGVCGGIKERICENLICKLNKKECLGKEQVAADGTKCAENKWCFKKKCIEMGARPESVHGGWGDYGPWSKCTRTCGGGISFSERQCNNPPPANKGRYCSGERKKLKICNVEPCPENDPTFRQQQCTDQNAKPWNGQYHTWKASLKESEPCALYCLNEQMALSKLENFVKDGTPCKHGTRNMCISGTCKPVGCDDKLDSEAVEDRCGICNGDGTQCKIVEDIYKEIGQGYTKVVVIPAGARKVVIEELKPSTNIIAISDNSESKFYLNGDHTEELDNEYKIGKQIGIYTHIEPKKEKLIINGPLKEDLVFFVDFFEEISPGYSYHWSEPAVDSNYEPHYHWEAGEFEECSDACDTGTQKAELSCMEDSAGKVSSNFCAGIDKPKDIIKDCNEQPCKISWKIGSWGKCRACKGKSGVRVRVVECIKQNRRPGADGILVEDCLCKDTRPGAVELCDSENQCGRKRMASYIPGNFQKIIYQQMFPHKIKRIERMDPDGGDESVVAEEKEIEKSEPIITAKPLKERVGELIHDFKPIEDQILVKYTLRSNPLQYNLSDKAYAQMGDVVGDIIDTENKMVFTGKAAVLLEHDLERISNTTVKIVCENKEEPDDDTTEDIGENGEEGDKTATEEEEEEQSDQVKNTQKNDEVVLLSSEATEETVEGEIFGEPLNEPEVEVGEDTGTENGEILAAEAKYEITKDSMLEVDDASKIGKDTSEIPQDADNLQSTEETMQPADNERGSDEETSSLIESETESGNDEEEFLVATNSKTSEELEDGEESSIEVTSSEELVETITESSEKDIEVAVEDKSKEGVDTLEEDTSEETLDKNINSSEKADEGETVERSEEVSQGEA